MGNENIDFEEEDKQQDTERLNEMMKVQELSYHNIESIEPIYSLHKKEDNKQTPRVTTKARSGKSSN